MGGMWCRAALLSCSAAQGVAAAAPVSARRRLVWLCQSGTGPLPLPALHAARPFLRAGAGRGVLCPSCGIGSGNSTAALLRGQQQLLTAARPAASPAASPAEPQALTGDELVQDGSQDKLKWRGKSEQAQPEESSRGDADVQPPLAKMKSVAESIGLDGEGGCRDHSVSLAEEEKEGAFSNFPLSENTINLLKARGVKYLFPVQVKTFQPVYDGKDIIAQARTGTGKTFAFVVPLIEKLQSNAQDARRGRAPKVLVLVPTRELVTQIATDFKTLTRKLSVACFYGGTPYKGQINHLKSGIDILVGTPGRIKDHIQNSGLQLSSVKHVVLDEVDYMLQLGFAEQVEEILRFAYREGSENNPQTLLFSATCPAWVYGVAKKYMKGAYEQIDLIGTKAKRTATTVEHLAIQCHSSQRAGVLGNIIKVYGGSQGRTIVFCETKNEVDRLSWNAWLRQDARRLHGDIVQKQREITLKDFRNGVFGVLIATNVAARGLDIPEVDLVIQCSPPKEVDFYIHRSGRTGRAGRTGICICLFQRGEERLLKEVEHKAGITFKHVSVPSATDAMKTSRNDAKKEMLDKGSPRFGNSNFKKSSRFKNGNWGRDF